MPLDPTVKAKWINALRSGRYLQTDGVLRRQDPLHTYYCCLGVLCEIQGLSREGGQNYRFVAPDGTVETQSGRLGPLFLASIGLDERDMLALTDMNDGNDEGYDPRIEYGYDGIVSKSFAGLADWIDSHL